LVDAWVIRILFDEGGDNVFPSIVAISVLEPIVKHVVVDSPDDVA
jgi:hypothetical protein